MSFAKRALLSLGRIGIIIGVAIAFFLGLAGTIYLSLRTSEVKVPDLVGKDRMTGESSLSEAGLNIRVRATRPATDAKPDTILAQLPHAGEVVKVGQTVAVDVSRAAKEGESTISASTVIEESKKDEKDADSTRPGDLTEKNSNDNANKEKRKKPVNKNANNSNANDSANANNASNVNNAKNGNTNNLYGNRETNTRNANQLNTNARNTNGVQNANTNRATNTNIRNTNTNRNPTILNTNRRAPNVSTPTLANPNTNRRTTP